RISWGKVYCSGANSINRRIAVRPLHRLAHCSTVGATKFVVCNRRETAMPLVANFSAVPPLAFSTVFEVGALLGVTIAVVVSAAIPLTTGVTKGHVALGIVFGMITVPIAALFGCIGGLPAACIFSVIISLIPKANKPLLSHAEVEAEMR